jgi:putative hydrolase of the HAD superfamily
MIDAAQIRAVVLDVDGTLYSQGRVRRTMLGRLVRAYWRRPASGVTVTRVLAAYRKAQESLRDSLFEGDVDAAQIELAARETGADPASVRAFVDEWMESIPLDLVAANARPGMREALDTLAESGVKLGVVSDYPAQRKLEALGIAGRIDVVVSAQDERVGAFKPNPRGIAVALEDLGVEATDAVYVGDRVDVDLRAAKAAATRFVLIGDRRPDEDPGLARVTGFEQLIDLLERW